MLAAIAARVRFRYSLPTMSAWLAILFVVGGLTVLVFGGEVLLRGAVSAARSLRVSPGVIGLTIVAMATSLPELAVSLTAKVKGSADVAVGNVVGSNIFNVAAILGLSAVMFAPLRFRARMIRFDTTAMVAAAVLAVAVSRDGSIGRVEGAAFLAMLVMFLAYRARSARQPDIPDGEGSTEEIAQELPGQELSTAASFGLILAGAALLTGGAELLVRGATRLAVLAGVTERVVAVTLVAAGTGLPELTTTIMASLRRHPAVAVGNVIGSNIFNVLGILGCAAVISPLEVSDLLAHRDMWWMLAVCSLVLLPAFSRRQMVSRLEGAAALVAYGVYLFTLL